MFSLYLMFKVSPLAQRNYSFVLSLYLVGMITSLMQFWLAPLSMRATAFVEKPLTAILIIEYHFWIVTWEIVWRNYSWETSFSGMSSIFWKLSGIREELRICVSMMESFVWGSRSFALRLTISYLRFGTWAFSSLTSIWMSFIVSY